MIAELTIAQVMNRVSIAYLFGSGGLLVSGGAICYDNLWFQRLSRNRRDCRGERSRVVKAPVCGTGDHGFEPRRSPQY